MLARLGRNVLSNWAGLAVTMAVAFFMSPFLVHTLGDAQYGVWVLILSVTGYMGLLDGGLKVSVVKFVASQSATGDNESLGETISTALFLYGLVAVLLLVAALTLGLFLDDLFDMPAELRRTASLVLFITGTTLSVTLMASVFNGLLAGLQRYDLINAVSVAMTLMGAVAIYLTVSRGFGIVGLGFVQLGASLVTGSLLFVIARRLRPEARLGWRQVRLGRARQLYGYSVFVLLNSLAMLLLFRSGELVTGVLLGAASVTYFAIGGMLVEYLGKIVGTMTQVLHPLASGQHARGDSTGLRTAVIVSTRACLAIAMPACAGFVIIGQSFIAAWMGESYAVVSGPVLAVLAVARLFWLSQSGAGNILLGADGHRQLTLLTAATGVTGIALAIALAPVYGLIGVALGLAIATITFQGLVTPIYVCRRMKIGMLEYLGGAVAGPLIATLPFAALMYWLVERWQPKDFGPIVAIVAIAAPVYVAVAYFSCLDREARARLRALLVPRRGSR